MSNENEETSSGLGAASSLSAFALINSGCFALQSLPLLFTPGLVIILLSPHTRDPTDIELHLCRFFSAPLLLAAATPLQDPSAHSLSWLHWTAVLVYHAVVFILSYTWWLSDGPVVLVVGMLASGALWVWGTFTWVFWSDQWRTTNSALFPAAEKRRMKVEKRERRWEKLQ